MSTENMSSKEPTEENAAETAAAVEDRARENRVYYRWEPPTPLTMTEARFEELVADALDQIPPKFAEAMDNVVVLVEDAHPESPNILGLYHGVALTERTSQYSGVLPDRISIYRLSILARCTTEEEVVAEVKVTVVHEIAHHFGIDDAKLHELGWG